MAAKKSGGRKKSGPEVRQGGGQERRARDEARKKGTLKSGKAERAAP